jgi:hypothetical protein
MIFGPKDDGTCVVEFRNAEGETLAISIPRSEAHRHLAFSRADALWAVRAGGSGRGRLSRGGLCLSSHPRPETERALLRRVPVL